MGSIECLVYQGSLPDSFFKIPDEIYKGLTVSPAEDKALITALFKMEAEKNEIIIYTDHQHIRLVGIFPANDEGAYFGFWEAVDDQVLNFEAFSLLERDARERKRKNITGPVNFNTYNRYRVRTGHIPIWNRFDNEPVNPVYYPSLLTQVNYKEKLTFQSRLITKDSVPKLYADYATLMDEQSKIPFEIIPLNEQSWICYERQLFELAEIIFNQNPFYKAVSFEQFSLLYNRKFIRSICPYSSVILKDRVSGRLAAMSIGYPDYQSLPVSASGRDFKRDFPLLEKKRLLGKTVGVHPDFRRQGLMNYLCTHAMRAVSQYYEEIIFCLMRSDNYSVHFTDHTPYESVKYILYTKELTS